MEIKENVLPLESKTDSFKIYLQVQLSGGFWDIIKEADIKDYNTDLETMFYAVAKSRIERGFKTRLQGIRIERISSITELTLE